MTGNTMNMTEVNKRPLMLLALLVSVLLAFGGQPALAQETPAPEETSSDGAGGNGGDNLALAVNTKDGSSVVKFAFAVRRVMSEVVTNTNAAVAVASCEDCRTVAVAIQIVLIVNDPEIVSPTNLALAYNIECTSCETLASAYQYVFTTGGQLMFTTEGWREIVDLRRQIHELLKDDSLDLFTLQAELDVLTDELYAVLLEELRPVDEVVEQDDTSGEGSPTPVPDQTTGGSSPTPDPEPSVAEPSPTSS